MPDWLPIARDIAIVILSLFGIALFGVLVFATLFVYVQLRRLLERAHGLLDRTQVSSGAIVDAVARPILQTAGAGVRGVIGRLRGSRQTRRS